MSVLDVNKGITEESLKSIGFFRVAYDVEIEIAIHEYIRVPSYLKFIPLGDNKYSNGGFVSVRYIPHIEELTICVNDFMNTTAEKSEKVYNCVNDIDEINILVRQYIQQIKK